MQWGMTALVMINNLSCMVMALITKGGKKSVFDLLVEIVAQLDMDRYVEIKYVYIYIYMYRNIMSIKREMPSRGSSVQSHRHTNRIDEAGHIHRGDEKPL